MLPRCATQQDEKERVGSRALRADAMEAVASGWLSFVVVVGLGVQWATGAWWVDDVGVFADHRVTCKEGREALERRRVRLPLSLARNTMPKGSSMRRVFSLLLLPLILSGFGPANAQDNREMVKLPGMMQEHMLGNMRDHLVTLDTIIGNISQSKFDEAAKVAEQRLGMSSLTAHDAAHMAPFMPKPMQDLGTAMHHAASRLVIVLQDASVTPTLQSMQQVDAALHEVTSACTSCHAAYRIR